MADTGIKRGSKFYICATPQGSDLNISGFEALDWEEVGKIVTFPDFGTTENIVSQDYVGTDLSEYRKGFRQGAQSSLVVGRDYEDDGQNALRAAADTRANYAFKYEGSDSPNPVTTTNTIRYSRGLVSAPNFTGGGGEDWDNEEFTIALNQVPITVNPEPI
jgi:hypothetical protein